ncbi:CubicO group peptidase (beta-lactamase class C family) [Pseudorhizobium tarimense]|uniref:CubicO group peptidase (Beta-lactamase class C family) n=1 Tax=Pseudorhizobium tarimense TaxID=1079109 RepID=A0ABV2H3M5_9HYPH|nr:serine hydrolase [Pseudorhizobium tarimense]MCJ8518436.1 beta-lactamase family protein [Pseudorhizobium tarimense]
MSYLPRIFKILAAVLVLCLIGSFLWLYFASPALLRVGAGYTAKIVCSNVFLAGRDPEEVLTVDVQAPGHPLLKLMKVEVDRDEKRVRAALLGFIASNEAVYREGLGCAAVPEHVSAVPAPSALGQASGGGPDAFWPNGDIVESDQAVAAVLSDAAFTGSAMRAVLVVRDGRIIGERYGEGFSADTPLLGWSMTKTVNAAIIGTLMREGRLEPDQRALLPQWSGDPREDITLADLLSMEDGLSFNENYGSVTDVTQMLYLEPDMAAFAAAAPLVTGPGTSFSYSSGSAVLLSRIWMNAFADQMVALRYPNHALFRPLGMRSAVLETDAAGTFVGSSYMYATGRDWARFALLLLRDGVWDGTRILPEGFVGLMAEPNGTSGGRYSKMQTWLPGEDEADLPADTFFLQGHDGQTIAVIPSLDLAVVRLGLTPRRDGYDVTPLVRRIVELSK